MRGRGSWEEGRERKDKRRKLRDKKVNKEGKRLIDFIEGRGWIILNGTIKGDEEGEYTYKGGRGETVIDYILGDEEVAKRLEKIEVGERIDSDHHLVTAWIRVRVRRNRVRENNYETMRRGEWDEKGKEEFRKKVGILEVGERDVQEEIEKMADRVRRILEEEEEGEERTIRIQKGWWDKECKEEKREVRKELRR